MKKVIFALGMIVLTSTSMAQKSGEGSAYSKGGSYVTLGYGIGNIWKSAFNTYGVANSFGFTSVSTKAVGPFALTYEYGIADKISIGAAISYASVKNTYAGVPKAYDQLTNFGIVARGNYHFATSEKFDPYVGAGLGYYNFNFKSIDEDGASYTSTVPYAIPGAFGFSAQLGAKYYFSSNIGAFAEVGYVAGGFAQLGLAAKF